ncbi:MAG: hypothetical protein E7259_01095 [Lachnospiraceae bacterium]|nr:hypothetical protein [Lachnospiraceae bacterium]
MERKWMKDWENFDWKPIKEALDKKEREGLEDMDIGITFEEFLDFLAWLGANDKATLSKLMLVYKLVDIGLPLEHAFVFVSDEALLDDMLLYLKEKLGIDDEDEN